MLGICKPLAGPPRPPKPRASKGDPAITIQVLHDTLHLLSAIPMSNFDPVSYIPDLPPVHIQPVMIVRCAWGAFARRSCLRPQHDALIAQD